MEEPNESSGTWRVDHRRSDDLPDDFETLSEERRGRLATERVRLLHVHGAHLWHDDVRIVGNRNGLTVVRDAIDDVLATGRLQSRTTAMVRDGEGFSVLVDLLDAPWSSPAWEHAPLPYGSPLACGGRDPSSDLVLLRQALRAANVQLVKRGVRPVSDPTASPADTTAGG